MPGPTDRGSTQAVDAIFTVFILGGTAILLPTILTIVALGAVDAPADVGAVYILGFWSLLFALVFSIGALRRRGGG